MVDITGYDRIGVAALGATELPANSVIHKLSGAQVIKRPNSLKVRLGGSERGSGFISPAAIARAEKSVEAHSDRYLEQARRDLATLQATYHQLRRDRQSPTQYLDNLSRLGREMKGQAGTFNFHLLTRFGDSLYELTRRMNAISDRHMDLIKAHIDAIEIVVTQDIRGSGGDLGEELSNTLRAAIQRVAAEG
ncbi:MAG: hypothetical protein KI792_01525 [Alphaproteobacteria bacterium]|nr:hypothetical protein [Alphaproteobacteria bacterium SS10]